MVSLEIRDCDDILSQLNVSWDIECTTQKISYSHIHIYVWKLKLLIQSLRFMMQSYILWSYLLYSKSILGMENTEEIFLSFDIVDTTIAILSKFTILPKNSDTTTIIT